jgi:hypothetical protein
MDASHNYAKAKRLWFANDIKKSKKNIVHGLRYGSNHLKIVPFKEIPINIAKFTLISSFIDVITLGICC